MEVAQFAEMNAVIPRNAKERVDDNADGNNEEVEVVAASLLQQVLLPVHNHRRDLLVLVCKPIFRIILILAVITFIIVIIP